MLHPQFAVYSGKNREGGFSGTIVTDDLYFAYEVEEGMTSEQGKQFEDLIRGEIKSIVIDNLGSFEHFISVLITKHNVPTSFSAAAGYKKGNILYLKTIGSGRIFLKRNEDFAQIIEKDTSASGQISEGDLFIFTTVKVINLVGSEGGLKMVIDNKEPSEIVDRLILNSSKSEDTGAIAIFIRLGSSSDVQVADSESIEQEDRQNLSLKSSVSSKKRNILDELTENANHLFAIFRARSEQSGKRKIFTLIAVVIVFVILVWSVVLGVVRRKNAELDKTIQTAQELVRLKLSQAEEVAYLNLPRSIALIEESRGELEKLKKVINDSSNKRVSELEQMIKTKENEIVKKEEKNYEEFFDLTIDSKNAKGNKLYLETDLLSILDSTNKTIYTLSLTKKSLDKKTQSQLSSADLLAGYKEEILFLTPEDGVFKIGSDDKTDKVIENDPEWATIADMSIYNGNLYLLDSAKGDIYKYLVTENGYSGINSYLKDEAGSVKNAKSLAIDSAVYVGFNSKIMKFIAGVEDEFSTSWPENNVNINKIFTSSSVEKVYGWDKKNGAIFILSKNGSYERQVKSSILTKASDFVVFRNDAFILVNEKIYKIDLD